MVCVELKCIELMTWCSLGIKGMHLSLDPSNSL